MRASEELPGRLKRCPGAAHNGGASIQEAAMSIPVRTLIAAGALAAAATAGAGTVEVAAVHPSSYTDAGNAVWQERENVEALSRHLQALGQRWLAPDQKLAIELLDVDLAGSLQLRGAAPVRTVRGSTDFPRIQLRYTLTAPGQASRSGEEDIRDIQYARGLAGYRSQPLYYEKRMLENWFAERFAAR
jgi:hypothetical protein